MTYQMAPTPVTLNDLADLSPAAIKAATPRPFVQHFTKFQMTQCVAQSIGDSWASCCFQFFLLLFWFWFRALD